MLSTKCKQRWQRPQSCVDSHEILPKRSRRTIFGDTFGVSQQLAEVLGYVPHVQDGISRYVCGFCFTKLNKLSKIDYDILHRVESLRAERYDMIKTLGSKYLSKFQSCQSKVPSPDVSTSMTNTPTMLSKRVGLHSLTPRKVKKPMQATPRRNVQLTSKPDNIQNVPSHTEPPAKKRVAIQLFSPDKVKVIKLISSPSVDPGRGNLTTHALPNVILENFCQFWVCPPF